MDVNDCEFFIGSLRISQSSNCQSSYTPSNSFTKYFASNHVNRTRKFILIDSNIPLIHYPFFYRLKESSNNKIRCAAVWVLINLCQQDKSSRAKRSPSEIGITLKRLGVGAKLANMIEDPCLDVRERVRDCILAVELITRF